MKIDSIINLISDKVFSISIDEEDHILIVIHTDDYPNFWNDLALVSADGYWIMKAKENIFEYEIVLQEVESLYKLLCDRISIDPLLNRENILFVNGKCTKTER